MATLSTFRITQDSVSGTWDRARRDITVFSEGGVIECEAEQKTQTSYKWEMYSAPEGVSVTINNSTTHTCNFNLTVRGGYVVKLTVNEGLASQSITSLYIGIAYEGSALCVPALGETNQDNSQSPYTGVRGTEEKQVKIAQWNEKRNSPWIRELATNRVLTEADDGLTFLVTVDAIEITMPVVRNGFRVTVMCLDAVSAKILPNASEKFRGPWNTTYGSWDDMVVTTYSRVVIEGHNLGTDGLAWYCTGDGSVALGDLSETWYFGASTEGGGGAPTALGEVWLDSLNGSDVTGDGTTGNPFASLAVAYAYAKTLTPGGQPLSQVNRAVVKVRKGLYYLTANLDLDGLYVDVMGEGVCSWLTGTYPGSVIVNNGFTLSYSSLNIVVDTLTIVQVGSGPECSCLLHAVTASGLHFEYFKNIYFFGTGSLGSMRALVISSTVRCYSNFENCHTTLGGFLFGGGFLGTAKNCSGGNYSFSGWKDTSTYAINGYPLVCNGTLEDCQAGEYSFGAIDGNVVGGFSATLDGTFIRCSSSGGACFGCVSGNTDTCDIDVTGKFTDCISGAMSFGYTDDGVSTFQGVARRCSASGGSFGNTAVSNDDVLMENCSVFGIETAYPFKMYNGNYLRNKFTMSSGEIGPAISLDGNGACVYDCDIYGPNMTSSIGGGGPRTIKMAHCRMNAGFGASVSNSLSVPYNLIDTNYTFGGFWP